MKPANIKVNLSFALANAFRLKTLFSQKDIWLVLAIIHLIVDLFTSAVKRVDEASALILLATFRLQEATSLEIKEYASKILPQSSNLIINDKLVQEALDNLEELKYNFRSKNYNGGTLLSVSMLMEILTTFCIYLYI